MFTATGSTADVGKMPVLYSSRGNRPVSLRLTSTTSTAPLDTLTRIYSAIPRATRDRPRGGAAGTQTAGTCRRRCRRRESRDDRFVSRGRGGRLLGPCREGRTRDERFVSRGRGGRLLGPDRDGRKRENQFVSRGRSGRILGPGREGRKRDETSGSAHGAWWTPPRSRQGGPKATSEQH